MEIIYNTVFTSETDVLCKQVEVYKGEKCTKGRSVTHGLDVISLCASDSWLL